MLVVRSVPVRFILPTMTSVAATASTKAPGLRESPGPRLQKLLSVPGSDPRRVNDLLLLRPDPGGQGDPGPEEKSSNRHVVFFHGDIQVSD